MTFDPKTKGSLTTAMTDAAEEGLNKELVLSINGIQEIAPTTS